MSEENAPKLRLKPKLAAEPANVPPLLAASTPPALDAQPPGVPDEPKTVRLKPKLASAPAPKSEPVAPFEPVSSPVEPPAVIGAFPPPASNSPPPERVPELESEKPASKFSLKPKAPVDSVPQEFPPPLPPVVTGSTSQSPIPAPDYVDPEEHGAPAMPRSLTSRPFPPPPGNFPPPAAAGARPPPPWAQSGASSKAPQKKNFALFGGGVVVVLLVLGGVFFAYKKFTTEHSARSPEPTIVAKPKNEEAIVQAPVEKPVEPVVAPGKEVSPANSASIVAPAPNKPAPVAAPEPVEVAPPPPPASAAFKAWVDAVKIGGVRAGATTRVFIGGTAYATGELVNPQLGIIFDSYNPETRHLTFTDKTGAKVDRRN